MTHPAASTGRESGGGRRPVGVGRAGARAERTVAKELRAASHWRE